MNNKKAVAFATAFVVFKDLASTAAIVVAAAIAFAVIAAAVTAA